MKVGLLFGSFDPVHNGHLDVARQAKANLKEVWFVVQPRNRFKDGDPIAAPAQRLELVVEAGYHAIAGHDTMIDSLKQLQIDHPHREFVILLGADLMESLPSWKDYKALQHFEIKPYARQLAVSSRQIRDLLKQGQPIAKLVPQSIHDQVIKLYS